MILPHSGLREILPVEKVMRLLFASTFFIYSPLLIILFIKLCPVYLILKTA
jgi:hypothetical protein